MKILVAVDDSPASGDLVDVICHRHWPDEARFKLVSVVEPFEAAEDCGDQNWNLLLRDVDQRRIDQAEKICSQIRNRIENKVPQSSVEIEILHGDARDEILNCAVQWQADKILIGAKGRKVCSYKILGSVSRAVATNAPCSVEIVRPNQHTEVEVSQGSLANAGAAE